MDLKTLKKLLREYSAGALGQHPPGTKDNTEGTGNTGSYPGTWSGTYSGTVGDNAEETPEETSSSGEDSVGADAEASDAQPEPTEQVNEVELQEFSACGSGAIQGMTGPGKIIQKRRKNNEKKRKKY